MQQTRNLKPKLLALALAGALGAAPLGAFAAPAVALTALENLGSADPTTASNVIGPFANGGDFFRSGGDLSGNTTFFHTYGGINIFSQGYFGARSSGQGTFYTKTSASYSDSFFNDTGVAQLLTFSYNVDSGEISTFGAGTGKAELQLRLRFNGALVSGDHGVVNSSFDGTTTTTTCDTNVGGAADNAGDLASYLSCNGTNSASGSGGAKSTSILVAAGDTLNIDYDIISEASGTYVNATSAGGYGTFCSFGYGDLVQLPQGITPAFAEFPSSPGESGCQPFNSLARSGDPAGLTPYNPANFSITLTPQGVPEPGTLALAGLALGGLAMARRKRKERQAA